MFNKIIEFLNDNVIIGFIVILFAVTIIMDFYNQKKVEGFEGTDEQKMCIEHKDTIFKQNYEGRTKLLNFRCVVDGKKYYLANMRVSECEQTEEKQIDCNNSILVLIPEDEMREKYMQYKKDIEIKQKICNAEYKIKCEADKKDNCDREYEQCKHEYQYIHDFQVTEYIDSTSVNKERKYMIRGVSTPKMEGSQHNPTIINNELAEKNVKLVCGDVGGNLEKSKIHIIEQIVDKGGIIGGLGSYITVRLGFDNGEKQYISVCRENKCKSLGKEYMRVCITNNDNKDILDFEPIIV